MLAQLVVVRKNRNIIVNDNYLNGYVCKVFLQDNKIYTVGQ